MLEDWTDASDDGVEPLAHPDVEGIDLSDLTIDPGLCDLTAEVELSEKEVEILTRSLDLTQTDDRKRLLLQPTANT